MLENVHCASGHQSFDIDGLPEQAIENLTLINVTMGSGVGGEYKCDYADCTCDALSSPCPSCCKDPNRPPPPPKRVCKVLKNLGCFNDSKYSVPALLPHKHEELHDRVSLENCAAACAGSAAAASDGGNITTIAGVSGGNHCTCGTTADLDGAEAKSRARPLPECLAEPCSMVYGDGCACTGKPSERCGATERLMAYSFTCSKLDSKN